MTDSTNPNLAKLSAEGVSVWLDDLSRELLESGDLQKLVDTRSVVGVTSNPTIFANALAKGDRYEEQVRGLAGRGSDVETAVFEITTDDVRTAADLFKLVYDGSDHLDGKVSLEVDPRLARDTDATIASARQLWATVDRPNLFIKIPATREGLPAIRTAISEGISVNVTLIFSIQRYREVMEAYLEGLEGAKAAGHDLSSIWSVASFFVSRVDTEIDKRLDAIGTDDALALRGEAAVANARLAYAAYQEVFAGDRWQALTDSGANPQRPLWASTGVKDERYPDTKYVTDLVVADTVNTMPEKTLEAFADHGEVDGDAVSGKAQEAEQVFARLESVGIDFDDVLLVLEKEGVEKFEKSWQELVDTIQGQLDKARS
jgi:transaldolase